MAIKNHSSRRTTSRVSIPANRRKFVAKFRAAMQVSSARYVTSAQAYRTILAGEKEEVKRLAKKLADEQAEKNAAELALKEDVRKSCVDTLYRGFLQMADVRDLLVQMEEGETHGFTAEALGTFARATLEDAATYMELALLDLGVINCKEFGCFTPEVPEKPEAVVAAA